MAETTPYVSRDVVLGKRTVTVFGASNAQPGDAAYLEAKALGKMLAQKGLVVVNGGYSGTMTGSAEGAREAGGEAYGVVVSGVFLERHKKGGANKFLSGAIDTPSITERIGVLLASDMFVVLPGHLGTLQEITAVWTESYLAPFHNAKPRRIYAWRRPWEALCTAMVTQLDFPNPKAIELIEFVDGVDDLARKLSC